MRLSLPIFAMAISMAQSQIMVPTPWIVQNISIQNIRHGTGGFWNFDILDTPTAEPQGFSQSCAYTNPTAYTWALDSPPINAPCNAAYPNLTFGLFPNPDSKGFTFNITHLYGDCSGSPCNDNGTWQFSWDDVRGQENDVQNNFGQAGNFFRDEIDMYPNRAVASEKCEFC